MLTKPVQNFTKPLFYWQDQSKISPTRPVQKFTKPLFYWQDRPKFHQLNQPKIYQINIIWQDQSKILTTKPAKNLPNQHYDKKSSPKFHQMNIMIRRAVQNFTKINILLIKSVEIFNKLTPKILDINGSNKNWVKHFSQIIAQNWEFYGTQNQKMLRTTNNMFVVKWLNLFLLYRDVPFTAKNIKLPI